MTDCTLLGVFTVAALITIVTCNICNDVFIGSTYGKKTERTAVVPPNFEEYDIQVQPVCPEDNVVGLRARGCNEYVSTFSITSKTNVHVHRDESPDEMYVKLTVYCN